MSNDTVLKVTTREEFEQMVREEYTRLRAAWFPTQKPDWLSAQLWQDSQQPAVLSFIWDDEAADCGYVNRDNRLIMAIDEGWLELSPDLEDEEDPTAVYTLNVQKKFTRDWSPWRTYLLHEMCHEYQFKVFRNHDQSSVGREMFHAVYCDRDHARRFCPTGLHPTPFLAAIASLAEHLGADKIEMFDRL